METSAALAANVQLKREISTLQVETIRLRDALRSSQEETAQTAIKLQQEVQKAASVHAAELTAVKERHALELKELQEQLLAAREEKQVLAELLDKERESVQGLMVTLRESRGETAWKRKLQQLRCENEALKEEVERHKRRCSRA